MSEINTVTNNPNIAPTAAQTQTAAVVTQENSQTEENKVEVAKDEYAGSVAQVNTGTYNNFKVDYDKINAMKAEMKNNTGAFMAMVAAAQKDSRFSLGENDANFWGNWVQEHLGQQYSVEEAQSLVADDGYWGVDQTSQRIVDFAKALSGGDPSQYDKLMNAIDKGFGAAKELWGGDMPDITQKTYDAVKEKMSAWKDEMNAAESASTSSTPTTQTENAVKAAAGASDK